MKAGGLLASDPSCAQLLVDNVDNFVEKARRLQYPCGQVWGKELSSKK